MSPPSLPAIARSKSAPALRGQPDWIRLIRAVHSRWATYAQCLADLRSERLTEKAVHDYRVASQRLAAALRVCAHAIPAPESRRFRRRIRRRFERFRRLRDVQVMQQRLAPVAAQAAVIGRLQRRLAREAADRQRKILPQLRKGPKDSERAQIAAILWGLRSVARGSVHKRVKVLLRARLASAQACVMRRSTRIVPTDLATLHRLRIAIKRARYLLELVAAAGEAPWARTAYRAARGWQDVLGKCQDLHVLAAELATLQSKHPADLAALRRLRTRIAAELDRNTRTFLRRRHALDVFVRQILPPGQPGPEMGRTLRETA